MNRTFKIVIFIAAFSFCLTIIAFIIKYRTLKGSERIPICNLSLIHSTSSCWIYLKIRSQDTIHSIVCPNDVFYNIAKDEIFMPFAFIYILRMGVLIEKGDVLEVGHASFQKLKMFNVNEKLIKKYQKENLLEDTLVIKDNYIKVDLDWEYRKAVIYTLLNQGVNYCYTCEGGISNGYIVRPFSGIK